MERTSNLKSLNAWSILLRIRKRTDFKKYISCYHTTLFTRTMDDNDGLQVTIQIYNWYFPDDH